MSRQPFDPAGLLGGTDQSPHLFVVETGQRWRDTALRFVGPSRHLPTAAGNESRERHRCPAPVVESMDLTRIRAAIASVDRAAILWECRSSETALSIAQVGVTRPDVMQIVAREMPESAERRFRLALRELGAAVTISSPVDFERIAPMILRFFARKGRHRDGTRT